MALRDLVLNHFWLKLFSLLLAALIWLAIRANLGNETAPLSGRTPLDATRIIAQCPVLLMTAASDRRAYKVEPGQVSVTVRGPLAGIEHLQDSDVHAYVPASAPRGPAGAVAVEVHAPAGITVVRVSPPAVTIKLAD